MVDTQIHLTPFINCGSTRLDINSDFIIHLQRTLCICRNQIIISSYLWRISPIQGGTQKISAACDFICCPFIDHKLKGLPKQDCKNLARKGSPYCSSPGNVGRRLQERGKKNLAINNLGMCGFFSGITQ